MKRQIYRKNIGIGRNPRIISTTPKEPVAIYIPKSFFYILMTIIIIVGGWYFIFKSEYFKIKQILIEGEVVDSVKVVLDQYKGENIINLSSGEMKDKIIEVYPEAYDIKVYRGLPDTLKVEIKKREPAAIWQSGSRFYILDKGGLVIDEKSEIGVGYQNLPKVVDKNNVEITKGQRIASVRLLNFITNFNKAVKDKTELSILGWEVYETTIQIKGITNFGWGVIVSTDRPYEYQLEDLATIYKKHKNDIKEYVDLRVSGYGYYK